MSGRPNNGDVIRSPLLPPGQSESQSSFAPRTRASGTSSSLRPMASEGGASFDELVYQFTTTSKTLSSEERLGFLKQSKDTLEKIEGSELRQTLDQAQRARERVQAARVASPQPESGASASPPPTGGRTAKREALSSNTPLAPSTPSRPRGPFLVLDEEVVREEQLKKHGHYLVTDSPRQIYSVRGDGAVHTPQKVALGAEEAPTVLNDYFPEPVRNRQRRRGSYANYKLPADTEETYNSRGSTSGRQATPRSSAGGGTASRRSSVIVLAAHATDNAADGAEGTAATRHSGTDPFDHAVPSHRPSGLVSPASGRQRRASVIASEAVSSRGTEPTASMGRGVHPYSLQPRMAHVPPGAGVTTPTAAGHAAVVPRSRSAGGQRRRGSFTSGKRANTPQTRGTFSRNLTPSVHGDSAQPTPSSPTANSLSAATPPQASLAPSLHPRRRSRRNSTNTPRRGSMLSTRSARGEVSPRVSQGSEAHAHAQTDAAGSAQVVVPILDVAELHHVPSGTLSASGQSPQQRALEGPSESPVTPRAGVRTARTRHLYQAQRAAILDLLNEEIRNMQSTVSPQTDASATEPELGSRAQQMAPVTATPAAAVGRHTDPAAEAPRPAASTPATTAAVPEPIRVQDTAPYPDVVHALGLLEGSASSAYNWVMLAESMSEAQLLPPHQVQVVYTPDPDSSGVMTSTMSPSAIGTDAQGHTVRWMGMKEVLIEALNIDNDMKNAWEGLALLLAPDEKVVVRKARTGRPITVNNVECYVRLLRSEPTYFYGWMGLGCAMVEEQKKLTEEARLAEAETKAMEAMVVEHEAAQQEKQGTSRSPQARGEAGDAPTPPPSQIRRGRREPALTLDDGLRLLEEEDRNARRLAASRSGAGRTKGGTKARAEATTSSPPPPVSIPAVTHDVLFGKRPFEAKDCFAHAAQLCPWESSIWLQILMALPDSSATVEFDAPSDEREWADVMEQRAMMEAMGGDLMAMTTGDGAETADPAQRAAAEAVHQKMVALDDERLLKGCVLSFAEVAGIALELNAESKDVWRYVGERLAPSGARRGSLLGRPRRDSTSKPRVTATSAGVFVSPSLNSTSGGGGQDSHGKRPRRNSMKAASAGTAAPPTTSVAVAGTAYTREQCFKHAQEVASRQIASTGGSHHRQPSRNLFLTMPCGSNNQTVDTETDSRHSEMKDLENNYKAYESAIQETIKCYRKLLQCFDSVGTALSNMANTTDDSVRVPVRNFGEGMSEMKDKGAFATYVSEMTQSMNSNFSDVKEQLKTAKASYSEVKSTQKKYEKARSALTKKEADYTKKGKVIEDSGEYPKLIATRDDSKKAYEDERERYKVQSINLNNRLQAAVLESMNEFAHSTGNFSGYVEATMNGYRTDADTDEGPQTKMDHARAAAESQSVSRRGVQANLANAGKRQQQSVLTANASSANMSGYNNFGAQPNPLQTDITPAYPMESPSAPQQYQAAGGHDDVVPYKSAAPLPDSESTTNNRSRMNSDANGYSDNAQQHRQSVNDDAAAAQKVPSGSQYP